MDIGHSASQSTANYQLPQGEVITSSWDTEDPLNTSNVKMAKTKYSVRGKQEKKIVVVKGYTTKDGTKVREHRRSTPN